MLWNQQHSTVFHSLYAVSNDTVNFEGKYCIDNQEQQERHIDSLAYTKTNPVILVF